MARISVKWQRNEAAAAMPKRRARKYGEYSAFVLVK